MSYTKITDFASKDALLSGNPAKIIKGTEIDDELNSIESSFTNDVVEKTGNTGSAKLPSGTTAQRDPSPANGYTRYNTSNGNVETYRAGVWTSIGGGGGAVGGGANKVFYENDAIVTDDYEIGTGANAMTAGPITINSGVTITIPSGSTWTVV